MRTAALLALYTLKFSVPWIDTVDAVRITEAPSTSNGKAFCTVNKVPRTLVPKMRSKCSSVIAPSGIMSPPPALANRMSSLPALLAIWA
ncbi:hypothetical protein D3C75_1247920 [compost metagenome]